MAFIEDGGGKNGLVGVSKNQRFNTSSRATPREFYSSRDDGLAYTAVYPSMTLAAGDICAYLKNTSSTRNLFVGNVVVGGVADGSYKIFKVTGTAASGGAVTPVPLNLSKSIPAEATAMEGDTSITGLTFGSQLSFLRHPALSGAGEKFEGSLILGPGDAIAIEMDAGTGGVHDVEIHFHYEDFDA